MRLLLIRFIAMIPCSVNIIFTGSYEDGKYS